METCKCIIILLLYCAASSNCYPSKPLNERSPPELTWQAWLLVDDQNQNKQQTNADGILRRRITPKSVFIAPTFSPESLPACADGYTSDVMGRCVPIIKIDEDAHYGFLIERLKQKFGPIDYDYQEEEDTSTQGPLQINIPLQVAEEDDEEDTDVAIVISPTKALGVTLDKRDSIDDEKKQEFFLKSLAAATTQEPEETSTVTEPIEEETSVVTDDLTTVTEAITSTEQLTTLSESHNTKRSTGDLKKTETTTTEEMPETTTFDPTTIENLEMSTPAPTSEEPVVFDFKFPESHTDSFQKSYVKFPDTEVSFQTQIPSSLDLSPSTRDINKKNVFPVMADTPVGDRKVVFPQFELPANHRKVVFRDRSQPEEANLDYSNGARSFPSPTTAHRSFNRRNRDKSGSMYLLPPRWSEPNFQGPLVLRFSRKHSYLDEAQFKHPDYYRTVPADDYAFLFSKHKQSSNR